MNFPSGEHFLTPLDKHFQWVIILCTQQRPFLFQKGPSTHPLKANLILIVTDWMPEIVSTITTHSDHNYELVMKIVGGTSTFRDEN